MGEISSQAHGRFSVTKSLMRLSAHPFSQSPSLAISEALSHGPLTSPLTRSKVLTRTTRQAEIASDVRSRDRDGHAIEIGDRGQRHRHHQHFVADGNIRECAIYRAAIIDPHAAVALRSHAAFRCGLNLAANRSSTAVAPNAGTIQMRSHMWTAAGDVK